VKFLKINFALVDNNNYNNIIITLETLVFEERGKPEYPGKNLSEQRREPTTNNN